MQISLQSKERKCLLSVADALQLMIAFGSLLVSLISLIVVILKKDTKK